METSVGLFFVSKLRVFLGIFFFNRAVMAFTCVPVTMLYFSSKEDVRSYSVTLTLFDSVLASNVSCLCCNEGCQRAN